MCMWQRLHASNPATYPLCVLAPHASQSRSPEHLFISTYAWDLQARRPTKPTTGSKKMAGAQAAHPKHLTSRKASDATNAGRGIWGRAPRRGAATHGGGMADAVAPQGVHVVHGPGQGVPAATGSEEGAAAAEQSAQRQQNHSHIPTLNHNHNAPGASSGAGSGAVDPAGADAAQPAPAGDGRGAGWRRGRESALHAQQQAQAAAALGVQPPARGRGREEEEEESDWDVWTEQDDDEEEEEEESQAAGPGEWCAVCTCELCAIWPGTLFLHPIPSTRRPSAQALCPTDGLPAGHPPPRWPSTCLMPSNQACLP